MRLKQKLATLFTTLSLFACVTVGAVLPVLADSFYDATGDWTKSANADNGVSITAAQDGGAHFSQTATGAWDGCYYTAGYYNDAVSVSKPIDMYMNVQSGQVAIVLSGNGWVFEQQGSNVINWNPTVSVVLTHYGEEIQLQRTDNWATAKKTKLEGYNKLTFDITANGTDILFNDETVFSFSSTSVDYTYGTAQITVNRFSAESVLDTVVRSIPLATESAVTYNNASSVDFKVGYKGVDPATVTGVKYAVSGATEYTAIAEEAVTATAGGVSVAADAAKTAFATAGAYDVVVETMYGNVYYNATVVSEKDMTANWSYVDSATATLSNGSDKGVTYTNSPSSVTDGMRMYDVIYNGEFTVENDVVIDVIPQTGITSFALTDGKNGTVVLEMGLRKSSDTEFVHCVNYMTDWSTAALNTSGYTRLTFVIGETSTEVLADGVSIGEATVGKSAFASGKVGVKAGVLYYSWAPSAQYDIRLGETGTYNVTLGNETVATGVGTYTFAKEAYTGDKVFVGYSVNGKGVYTAGDMVALTDDITIAPVEVDISTIYGASIRLDDSASIRFSAILSEADLAALEAMAGAANVSYGIVLYAGGNTYTVDSKDEGFDTASHADYSGYVYYSAVMTGIPATDYDTDITAVAYIRIGKKTYKGLAAERKDGDTQDSNVRSLAFVAEGAYNLRSETQQGNFQYYIEADGNYSWMSAEDLQSLKQYFQAE